MAQQKLNEKLIARYLLRDLSEKERASVEERYFANDEFFELMLAIEEELVEKYAAGRLSNRQRQLFESNYLPNVPQRQGLSNVRDSIVLSRTLSRVVGSRRPEPTTFTARANTWFMSLIDDISEVRPSLQYGFIILLLCTLLGVWFAIRLASVQSEMRQRDVNLTTLKQREATLREALERERASTRDLAEQVMTQRTRRESLERQLSGPKESHPPMLAFVLSPGALRNIGALPKLVLPQETQSIAFQLDVESEVDYATYRAVLQRSDSSIVWSKDGLREKTTGGLKLVALLIDSRAVEPGNYDLKLYGRSTTGSLDDVGHYYFTAERRSK